MCLPSRKSVLVFIAGFSSCLLCLGALVCGAYSFWFKPMVSTTENELAQILDPPPFPAPRQAIFNFSFMDTKNKRINFQSYRGRVVILNFWATWCPPCMAELPTLGKLANCYAGQSDVSIVCVSDESLRTISSNHKVAESRAPVYSLNGQQIPQAYATEAIPATFVIDTNGMIVFEHVGSANWADPSVVKFIDSLRGKMLTMTNSASTSGTNNFKLLAY